MITALIAILLLAGSGAASVQAQPTPPPTAAPGEAKTVDQQTVCEGKEGEAALSCIQSNYGPDQTLGYDTARDTLYANIDASSSGELKGIYSGFTIVLSSGKDLSSDAFDKGINAEHVFPQSKGAGNEPQKSDMHNLYPARVEVNSARGNLPLGESPDGDTDKWYYEDQTRASTPSPRRFLRYPAGLSPGTFPSSICRWSLIDSGLTPGSGLLVQQTCNRGAKQATLGLLKET